MKQFVCFLVVWLNHTIKWYKKENINNACCGETLSTCLDVNFLFSIFNIENDSNSNIKYKDR